MDMYNMYKWGIVRNKKKKTHTNIVKGHNQQKQRQKTARAG